MTTSSTVFDDDSFENNWMQTFTGRQFFPFKPWESEVVIEDIAHHLSIVNRFTGATRVPYSVAQHSVLASQLVPPGFELEALLHDASEAYLNDMSSPVKAGMTEYRSVEERVSTRIMEEFGVVDPSPHFPWRMSDEVKQVDLVLVATEARDLMANPPTLWKIPVPPLAGVRIDPWTWDRAKAEFLRRFEQLTR